MSRLFDALQISSCEKSGNPFSGNPFIAAGLIDVEPQRLTDIGTESFKDAPEVHISPPHNSSLISLQEQHSFAAERFGCLAVKLRHLQQKSALKSVLVTSAIAEEGKSFVSANLAITLAQKQRQKVLLIEGDLRLPTIAYQFGLQHLPGLSESLAGNKNGDGTMDMVYLNEVKLWFTPCGAPPEDPLELLQSSRLADYINHAKAEFDWIIIDAPPLLPFADSTIWSRLSDGALLVVREGRTQRKALTRSLEVLTSANLIGAVFNSCSGIDQTSYYYQQRDSQLRTATARNHGDHI